MNENLRGSRFPPMLIVLGIACALLAIYVGSYLAIVSPQRITYHAMVLVDGRLTPLANTQVLPEYRIGGTVADWLFWPAHRMDRQIRKETWGT